MPGQFPGEQGKKAAELLFDLIGAAGPPEEPVQVTFKSRLITQG